MVCHVYVAVLVVVLCASFHNKLPLQNQDVVQFLADLCNQPHVASVMVAIHKVFVFFAWQLDHPHTSTHSPTLHSQDVVTKPLFAQLQRQCTSWVDLAPCTVSEQRWSAANGMTVHGKITARHKRATGRVRVETDGYVVLQGGGVAITPAPSPPSSAQELVARALQAGALQAGGLGVGSDAGNAQNTRSAGGVAHGAPMSIGGTAAAPTAVDMMVPKIEGGMRLGLTEEVRVCVCG